MMLVRNLKSVSGEGLAMASVTAMALLLVGVMIFGMIVGFTPDQNVIGPHNIAPPIPEIGGANLL